VIEPDRFAFVEDAQVVVGMRGHPNHVRHRQQRSTSGKSFTGAGFQLAQRRGDNDRRR
jgi:hypothetical protein